MRRGSGKREQTGHNTPHEARKRVLSVFGVYSGTEDGLEQPRGLQDRLWIRLRTTRYTNTNGSPIANGTLTMITETKPIERKGWRSTCPPDCVRPYRVAVQVPANELLPSFPDALPDMALALTVPTWWTVSELPQSNVTAPAAFTVPFTMSAPQSPRE